MSFAIVVVPAAPLRKKPSHKKEITNQLLFGEIMRVMKQKKNWSLIQSVHDFYRGWIRNNLIRQIDENLAAPSSFLAASLVNTIEINGEKMQIPFAANLPQFKNNKGCIAKVDYIFNGYAVDRNLSQPLAGEIKELAMQWLNAPYLWGGRTIFGVDCSGFTQVIFKMLGFDLLRDAKQQITQGMKVKSLKQARCGDLAFFKKKGKIVHVGILLSHQQIIHASGKVRIDSIDEKGIIHAETGVRTHLLAAIKRYW